MRRLPVGMKNYTNFASLLGEISNCDIFPGINVQIRTKNSPSSVGRNGEYRIKKNTIVVWAYDQKGKLKSERLLLYVLLHEYCHAIHFMSGKHQDYYRYCTDSTIQINLTALFDGYLAETDCDHYAKKQMWSRFRIRYSPKVYPMSRVAGFYEFTDRYKEKSV